MKSLVFVLLSVMALTASAYDYEYKYSGKFFKGEDSLTVCIKEAKALAYKLDQEVSLEKMTILEANCIKVNFLTKGYKVLISYMAPMSLEIKDFKRTYKSETACESSLTQIVSGMSLGKVFVADFYCQKRSQEFELNVTYVNSNHKSFDSYEHSPYFNDKDECLSYADKLSDKLASFDSTTMIKGCQGVRFGMDGKVYYHVEIDHLMDIGKKVYLLRGKKIEDPSRCLHDAREIEDRFNDNKVKVVDVFCKKRSKETHQYITYINKLINRVKRYRGTAYDSVQACKTTLEKISAVYISKKRKVLYSYCDTNSMGSIPVIHFLRAEPKLP